MSVVSRKAAERRGRAAELLVRWFLRLKGYRILAKRWRCKAGEIDLVAKRGPVLVFVEVKARPSEAAGMVAVPPHARRRIEAAAAQFLRARRLHPPPTCRFDLVVVTGRSLHHHKNAWRGGDR